MKANGTRLYKITADDGSAYLVDATNAAQAVRHVARNMFMVTVATPKDVASLVGDGVKVEHAAKPETEAA